MNPEFDKTLLDRVFELIRDNNPDGLIKEFYYGVPDDGYPADTLPCIVGEPIRTEILQGPTGMDFIVQTVTLRIIYNKLDEMGRSMTEAPSLRKIQEVVEGIDPTTGEYDTRTLVGVLRKNFTLHANNTNQKMIIEYGNVPGTNGEETQEAQISFTAEGYKAVTGRI